MNKRIAAGVLTAALAGSGTAGLFLTRAATAAEGGTTTTTPASGTAPAAGTKPSAADRTARRTDELTKTLQGLVDAGTITAEQRDAVIKAIVAADPAGRPGKAGPGGPGGMGGPGGPGGMGGPGRGGRGGPGGFVAGGLDAAAAALGTDAATLRTALEGGKSLADVAKDKGVAVDTVVAAIVAAETKSVDQAVTDGKMTQAQADTIKAGLTQGVTAMVNGTKPAGMPAGPGGGHGRGRGGQAPAAGSTPTTTPAGSSFTAPAQDTTTA